jgi:hypothetical protein
MATEHLLLRDFEALRDGFAAVLALGDHMHQPGDGWAPGVNCRECGLFAFGRRTEGCADRERWTAAIRRAQTVMERCAFAAKPREAL